VNTNRDPFARRKPRRRDTPDEAASGKRRRLTGPAKDYTVYGPRGSSIQSRNEPDDAPAANTHRITITRPDGIEVKIDIPESHFQHLLQEHGDIKAVYKLFLNDYLDEMDQDE